MEETTVKENNKLKTGIFSGSFNPVHIGHLALAKRDDLMDDRLRLELVEAAVAGYAKFRTSDIEFTLPQPTYTIDTLRTLDRTYPDREFHFIMGADNWSSINRWKESETLITSYPILIYPRKGYEINIPETNVNTGIQS